MFRLSARITFRPDVGRYARRFNEVRKQAGKVGALFWWATYLRKHFEPGGKGRYGYKPRLGDKPKKGKRKKPRTTPYLVVSGHARDRATGTRPGIKAFPARTRIELFTPDYIPQNPRRANMPHMAREIFTVRPGEQMQIERAMLKHAERAMKRMGETRTVIIR